MWVNPNNCWHHKWTSIEMDSQELLWQLEHFQYSTLLTGPKQTKKVHLVEDWVGWHQRVLNPCKMFNSGLPSCLRYCYFSQHAFIPLNITANWLGQNKSRAAASAGRDNQDLVDFTCRVRREGWAPARLRLLLLQLLSSPVLSYHLSTPCLSGLKLSSIRGGHLPPYNRLTPISLLLPWFLDQ